MDIAVHPLNSSVVYTISYLGGVFKSEDSGGSWHEINRGLPRHNARAIALDPQDVNVAYLGLFRNGIFKTLDGGVSWSRSSNGLPSGTLQTIVTDPANSSVLFTGYREGWIYRTTNSGASWSRVFSGPYGLNSLKIAPSDSNIVVFSNSDGLFRSTDGGTTWLQVPGASNGIGSFAIDPRDSNRLLAASYGVQLTTDGGNTWDMTYLESVFDIEIHPANPDLVFTNRAISTDGGLNWTEAVHTAPCLPTQITMDPSNPAIVFEDSGFSGFIGNGICKSTDGGTTWRQANKGLNSTIVFHYSLDPFNPGRIFAHTGQSNGLFYTKNAGMTWKDTGVMGGFYGAAILAHPSIRNLVFAGGWEGNQNPLVWRSTDGGATFSSISGGVQAGWTLTADPFDAQAMYCPTYEGVSKSTDGGFHWAPSNGMSGGAYEVVADPHVSGLLYAATDREGVMRSTDAGVNWLASNDGLTDLHVESLVLDRNNPSSMYASTPTGLFRTTNGGSSWNLWAKGYIRPTISPYDSRLLYGGTPKGAVVSRDAGRTWSPFGLENYSVTFVAFDPFDPTILYAGTFGNGLYRIRLIPDNKIRVSP